MDLFTRAELRDLLSERQGPCVSLFIPTKRGGGKGDPTRWRKCLALAEEGLVERGMRPAEAGPYLQPARALLEDRAFWRSQSDGLAFFQAVGFQGRFRLPLSFAQRVAVGRRFLITPLLPLVSGNGLFYMLALSQNDVRLLQGTREAVSPVELKGVPGNLAEALTTHDVDEPLTFHTRPVGAAGAFTAIYHGHGVGIDDHKDDLRRYFQQVDRGLRAVLRGERAPLVLASVDYLQPIFRRACGYAGLLPRGLEGNPDRLSDQELHRIAWRLVEPLFGQAQENALALYRQLEGTGRTARG